MYINNKLDVIIINGHNAAGKDTFVDFCKKNSNLRIANISTIDPIKAAAKLLGWKGSKEPLDRKFLSDLKDLAEEAYNCSYNYIENIITDDWGDMEEERPQVFFVHSREPEQIRLLKIRFNAKTLLIKSNRSEIANNHADQEVENYSYDYTIENNGTLVEFENKAINFIRAVEGEFNVVN